MMLGPAQKPRVVIIGGGFAGLAAARALRRADAEIVLVDRRNHHIFQPLLYQVATSVLNSAEVADFGNMAVVGKNYAVLERGAVRTSGFLTGLVWAFVHILALPQTQNRLLVQRQWLWSYFTGERSSRLISESSGDELSQERRAS